MNMNIGQSSINTKLIFHVTSLSYSFSCTFLYHSMIITHNRHYILHEKRSIDFRFELNDENRIAKIK